MKFAKRFGAACIPNNKLKSEKFLVLQNIAANLLQV